MRIQNSIGPVFAILLSLSSSRADANPISPRFTYSTEWPIPIRGWLEGAPVFEFEGVEDGTATLGSAFKLGTVFIHQSTLGRGFTFDGDRVPVNLHITAVDGNPTDSDASSIILGNALYGTVYPEGTVAAGIHLMETLDPRASTPTLLGSFPAGGLSLTINLAPDSERLWSMTPGTPVVAVDVYGVLHAAPVPEPGAWLVMVGGTVCFALNRSRRWKPA